MFYIGTLVSFVRLVVRRYAAEASAADVELAPALNVADIELYGSAKARLGLEFTMYSTYSDFAWHNVLLLSVVFMTLLGIALMASLGVINVCSLLLVMAGKMCAVRRRQQQHLLKVK
jgi:hypothetical protein